MSIRSLHLTNFQSHQESKLEFHPGINTIIGSSDSGKSAILRGLLWAVYNRPSGDNFVSHWTKNEKGKQIEECSITVRKNGVQEVKRFRNKDTNSYHVNTGTYEYDLEAIRTDVPEQISEFFNLSEVNIQKQMDAPFLLSESSGEVARFFNRIIKLDEIDKALSLIESKKRKNEAEIRDNHDDQRRLHIELLKYDWIEKVEPLINKAEKIEERIKGKIEDANDLDISIRKHAELLLTVEKTTRLIELEDKIAKIEKINNEIIEKEKLLLKLESSLDEYRGYIHQRNEGKELIKLEETIKNAIELNKKRKKLLDNVKNYQDSIGNYLSIREEIPIIIEKMEKLKAKMPNVCPICGGRLK